MNRDKFLEAIREKLESMLHKKFEYATQPHIIKRYQIFTDRERVEFVTDKKAFDRPFDSILDFLLLFKEIDATRAVATDDTGQSDVIIFKTTNYDRFKKIKGNRMLNVQKMNRIISDIENGNNLFRYYPITVRSHHGELEIADGQHRFTICQKMKLPVYYIIMEREIDLYEIAQLNSNTEGWGGKDYINCYTELGNKNYIDLKNILSLYALPLTTAISLLQSGKVNDGGGTKHNFQKGKFEVKYLDYTMELLEAASKFKNFKHRFSRSFIKALGTIKNSNKISLDEISTQVSAHPEMLQQQQNPKDYLSALETIMMYGKKNRIIIY